MKKKIEIQNFYESINIAFYIFHFLEQLINLLLFFLNRNAGTQVGIVYRMPYFLKIQIEIYRWQNGCHLLKINSLIIKQQHRYPGHRSRSLRGLDRVEFEFQI